MYRRKGAVACLHKDTEIPIKLDFPLLAISDKLQEEQNQKVTLEATVSHLHSK